MRNSTFDASHSESGGAARLKGVRFQSNLPFKYQILPERTAASRRTNIVPTAVPYASVPHMTNVSETEYRAPTAWNFTERNPLSSVSRVIHIQFSLLGGEITSSRMLNAEVRKPLTTTKAQKERAARENFGLEDFAMVARKQTTQVERAVKQLFNAV